MASLQQTVVVQLDGLRSLAFFVLFMDYPDVTSTLVTCACRSSECAIDGLKCAYCSFAFMPTPQSYGIPARRRRTQANGQPAEATGGADTAAAAQRRPDAAPRKQ